MVKIRLIMSAMLISLFVFSSVAENGSVSEDSPQGKKAKVIVEKGQEKIIIELDTLCAKPSKKKQSARDGEWQSLTNAVGGIRFGYVLNLNDAVHINSGYELAFENLISYSLVSPQKRSQFDIGLGVGYRKLYLESGFYPAVNNSNNLLIVENNVEGGKVDGSISVWSLEVPLMWNCKLNKKNRLEIGVAGIFNMSVKAGGRTELGETNTSVKYKGLNANPFGFETRLRYRLGNWFGIYGAWSPTALFSAPRGPQFSTMSMGVACCF